MIRTLTGLFVLDGSIAWQLFASTGSEQCEGVRVNFPLHGRSHQREALKHIEETVDKNEIDWLSRSGKVWKLNLDKLRGLVPDLLDGLNWATGTAAVEPEIEFAQEQVFEILEDRTYVRFPVYKEEYILQTQQKIFLSHKGADKPLVRRFFTCLKTLGFDPWLDEDAMTAGTELERGILKGFKDSCAAVFFITPNFADEGYLATEVDYAIKEQRSKKERFSIITIVLADESGKEGAVPELLKRFVWKEPATELDALNEIFRALPIQLGPADWKN